MTAAPDSTPRLVERPTRSARAENAIGLLERLTDRALDLYAHHAGAGAQATLNLRTALRSDCLRWHSSAAVVAEAVVRRGGKHIDHLPVSWWVALLDDINAIPRGGAR